MDIVAIAMEIVMFAVRAMMIVHTDEPFLVATIVLRMLRSIVSVRSCADLLYALLRGEKFCGHDVRRLAYDHRVRHAADVGAIPLGSYMAASTPAERTFMDPILRVPERFLYRVMRVDPTGSRTGRPTPRA